jgi:hypothetical protein
MKLGFSLILFSLFSLSSCSNLEDVKETSIEETILNAALIKHGSDKILDRIISFTFREKRYSFMKNEKGFSYARKFTDSSRIIIDKFTNNGTTRTVNDSLIDLDEKKTNGISNSLNSVMYFTFLPYFLQDKAVKMEFVAKNTIKGKEYDQIKVTFNQSGGGDDFEDEYRYWFNSKDSTMDYFAYSYYVNGGGIRFREAINTRTIQGIRFSDYKNFEVELGTNLDSIPQLFNQGKLGLLSKIENEEIIVSAPNN